MTIPESAIWHGFDPSGGLLPKPIAGPPGPDSVRGGVVAIVASGSTPDAWGPAAALGIARSWAQEGARVILADLGLERPSLHRAAGIPNVEGVSDLFLFGASIPRIARPMHEGAFFLAPAGTVTADPASIMAHPRWEALEEGFGSASAVLVLYVPQGDASLPGVLERAAGVILLGDEGAGDAPLDLLGTSAERLLAALCPGEGPEVEAGPDEQAASETEPPPSGEASGGDAAAAGVAGSTSEAPSEIPADKPRARPRAAAKPRSRTSSWLFLLLLVVIVGALAAAWLGYVEIPGLDLSGMRGP